MKNLPSKRLFVVGCVAAILTAAPLIGVFAFYRLDTTPRGNELETLIKTMPRGITVTAADQIVGTVPDRVSQEAGVLVTPSIMLASSNSQAASYGPAKNYTLRIWKRGDVNATVAVDSDGRVAGRWTWR